MWMQIPYRRPECAAGFLTPHDTAFAAWTAKKAEIDAMLARIQAFSDDRFGVDPERLHWGHVGDLDHHIDRLKQITDFAFHEGECAP